MQTLYITRVLKEGSPLLAWATNTGNRVIGASLLTFAAVPFIPPDDQLTDWWFFYSPRAVAFSGVGERNLPTTVKLAALGPGTARALEQAAGRVDFIGTGTPQEVAAAFGQVAAGQTVFFPRARQSRRSVQLALLERLTVKDAVCYDNVALPATEPVAADTYVFTSPLNVAAYLDHQPLVPAARVIAIGPSTGAALATRGVDHEVAAEPAESAIVAML